MVREKQNVNVVFIGHVDSGKSTTSGHLIYKCGGIDKRTIERFEKESNEAGKGSFKYAWVLDTNRSERERGITIDSTQVQFFTERNTINLVDAPGHRDFLKNMISGTSAADAACLVVPASKGEAETALSLEGSAREHATLAFTMGLKHMIIAINKMDTCDYSEQRFREISEEVINLCCKVGYKREAMAVIPISGWIGDNIVEPSDKMPWYKGWSIELKNPKKPTDVVKKSGKTLYDALDQLDPPPRPTDKPLRIPVQATYKISGIGTVPTGRIETGVLKPGMQVIIAPINKVSEVKSVEMHHEQLSDAQPGDSVGFSVKNINAKDVKRGMVVGDVTNDPPASAAVINAQVISVRNMGKSDSGIRVGYTPIVDVHTAHVTCKINEITKIDKRTGKPLPEEKNENPNCILNGEAAMVKMTPQQNLVCEAFSAYPPLGRFCFRDSNRTVAIGVIKQVAKKELDMKAIKAAAGGAKGKK